MSNDRYGLTQAVIDEIKTNTRRAEKSLDVLPLFYNPLIDDFQFEYSDGLMVVRRLFRGTHVQTYHLKPRYKIGEEVAVTQPYKDVYPNADFDMVGNEFMTETAGWNNKMFVRADWMPHRIRITDIQLQRLNNLTDEDCLKEGVEKWIDCYIVSGIMENHGKNNVCFDTPREAFAALIDRISGKGTWERNPWVYAYEFELIK